MNIKNTIDKSTLNQNSMKAVFINLLVVLALTTAAQDMPTETMYRAYLHADKALWKKAVDGRMKEAKKYPSDASKQYDLAFAYFSLLSGTMATKDESLFDEYIDPAKELLKVLIENNKVAAESKALLSATMGLQMGYSPMKGIMLGSKSSSLAQEAKTQAPLSAIAWRFYGSNKLYTPSAFGGDSKEATVALENSVKLFESKPEELKNNWLYLDTIVLLGQAYAKADNREKSIATFEKALLVEPQFNYAKQLLAKTKKNHEN
jgi:tetratricopeptide (TPR) repeat protein